MMPHKLYILTLTEEYEDENGDFHEGHQEWVELCECDAVPSGRANTISTPDGVVQNYSYTVYLPKGTKEIPTGEKVRISFFCKGSLPEKKEFSVKGFHSYQYQCKMWV